MDANTRPSTLTLLRAALIAGTIFLLPTPGDAPMDAAVDDMFSSAPLSVHPLVSLLPPPNVGSEAIDNVAVVIANSVDTIVNATVTSTGSRLPAIAVEILKDLTGIVVEHAIVYCSVLAASVLVAIFVSFRRFVTVAPTRLGVRLSARGRQFICLLWSILEAIRCHLGRNAMLEDEITRLRAELDEVTLRLATAEAVPADLKTLDEDSLPLMTADTEQLTEACVESPPSIIASLCLDTTNTDTVSDDEQTRTSEKRLMLDKSTLTSTPELDETTPYLVAARETDEAFLLPKTVMLEKEQNDACREVQQAAEMEVSRLRELVQSLESRLQVTVNALEETTLAKQVVEPVMAPQTQTLTKVVERLAAGLQYADGQVMEWQRRAKDCETRLEKEKILVMLERQKAERAERMLEDVLSELVAAKSQIVEAHARSEELEAELRKERLEGRNTRQRADVAELREARSRNETLSGRLKEEQAKVREVETQVSESQAKASVLEPAIEDERERGDSAILLLEEAHRTISTLSMTLTGEQTNVHEVEALIEESQAKASGLELAFAEASHRADLAVQELEGVQDKNRTLSTELSEAQTKVPEVGALLRVSQAKASELDSAVAKANRWADIASVKLNILAQDIDTLQCQVVAVQSAEEKVSAIRKGRDGLLKGLAEEMRGGCEMKFKLNDADSQTARVFQEGQALGLDLDATDAQQKVQSLSEGSQEWESQLQMTWEDNKRLVDAMRRAHFDGNVAKEEVQTISASTKEEMVRTLTQRIEPLEKEKRTSEGRIKHNLKLSTFQSTSDKQLLRTMKMQQSSAKAVIHRVKARLVRVTKRANELAKGNALEWKHRGQAKFSFRLRSKQILDRHRSTGSAARRKPGPVTLPTTKTFETAKTEDERKTSLLEHHSISAPTPDTISLCESPRGDMIYGALADGLCIPERPPPSDDTPFRGLDDREPSELPEVPYTATTLETIPAWSPLEIVETEAHWQQSIAGASASVVLLSGSDLPDLPSFPSGSVSSSRSLSRHKDLQVLAAGTPEASESVVLLSGSTLSDLPSFPSGLVSWSRSLPRTGLATTGLTRATDSVPVRSTPERVLLRPSLVFPDSLGSGMDDVVTAASLMQDNPSSTPPSALPTRSPRQVLTDPRVAVRAGMEAMLHAQRREQQDCLSPTPGPRAVSCSVKDSTPTSCSPVSSASVMNASKHARRSTMDSELSLMELFDLSFSVATSTPRKGSGLQQMASAESRFVEELEMSTLDMCPSFPALSLPHGMDAILPDYLVLPSVPVLTMGLEDSSCELSELVPGLTAESSLTENEASDALPLTNSLPASEDVRSSSGGRSVRRRLLRHLRRL